MTNALGNQLADYDTETAEQVKYALLRTAREAMRRAVEAEQRCEELRDELESAQQWREQACAIEVATIGTIKATGITCDQLDEERARLVDRLRKDRAR